MATIKRVGARTHIAASIPVNAYFKPSHQGLPLMLGFSVLDRKGKQVEVEMSKAEFELIMQTWINA